MCRLNSASARREPLAGHFRVAYTWLRLLELRTSQIGDGRTTPFGKHIQKVKQADRISPKGGKQGFMIYGLRVSWTSTQRARWRVLAPGVGLRISAGQIEVRF